MKSKWIQHEGKDILFIDLSNLKDDIKGFDAELSETVATIGQEMYTKPLHSVLVMVDLRNTHMTKASNTLLTERIKDTRAYVYKTAVVGLTGLRKMFLDYFSMLAKSDTGSFEEPESAKQWLVRIR